ncbi:MAG: glycosyltransferase [Nitrosopumilus sp. D6]|nr:MAG: glycosyltransferase [Nitrosopumilus sp. D6]
MYDILYYVLAGIMTGIGGAWIFLIKSMTDSFRMAPYLDVFENSSKSSPKVSVILPARNEEEFIGKCLESLLAQDYENYEIIAVDDSSEDGTGRIISECSKKHSEIVPVSAGPKPDGWMGKNWACMEGYKEASGQLLLFTDADTTYSKNVISLAVAHLQSLKLDALSAIPRMQTFDFWTRISLSMISVFLHTRFSALNVNNPAKNTGYFFGSFFILKRETYEGIGTHKGVREEMIEDGALGKRTKEAGYKIRMVRGEHLIRAVWARNPSGLWNALKRLMVPLYLQSKKMAVGILLAVAFLLFVPFPVLAASLLAGGEPAMVLCWTAGVASVLIYVGVAIEARAGLGLKTAYAAFAPLGGLVVILGFLAGMKSASVVWRGRTYFMQGKKQDSISV